MNGFQDQLQTHAEQLAIQAVTLALDYLPLNALLAQLEHG
jgi:hypothetical protein